MFWLWKPSMNPIYSWFTYKKMWFSIDLPIYPVKMVDFPLFWHGFGLPPRRCHGSPRLGAEIWSLGCCVLEMATGCAPWAERRFDNILQVEKGGIFFWAPFERKNWENLCGDLWWWKWGLMLMKMGIDGMILLDIYGCDRCWFCWIFMVSWC